MAGNRDYMSGIKPRLLWMVFLALPLMAAWSCGGGGESEAGDPVPVVMTLPADSLTSDGAVLHGTVNPNGVPTDAWFEWGPDQSNLANQTPVRQVGSGSTPQAVDNGINGLTPGTRYYFRVVGSNGFTVQRGAIVNFTTDSIPLPSVVTLGANPVGESFALLNGNVDPRGISTEAWYEWGTDPALNSFNKTPIQPMGSGSAFLPVSEPLSGLSSGTTYYFRLVAKNNLGGIQRGSINSFNTVAVPGVVTIPAINITTVSAMLRGSVDPNGDPTEAWFEWGLDPFLQIRNQTPVRFMGAGTDPQPISETLSGLSSGTIYYFRVVARNLAGGAERKGTTLSFTTGGLPILDKYVAFGDSITYGIGDNISSDDTSLDGRNSGGGFEPVLNNLLTASKGYAHSIVNEGFPGFVAEEGLLELPFVLARHPDARYYLVLFGTNNAFDLNLTPSGRTLNPGDAGYAGSYKDIMQQIIDLIVSAGKIPYLAKVPFTQNARYSDSLIREYNQVIDELVVRNAIPVQPPGLYNHFASNPQQLDPDLLHPNGVGYQEIARLWRDSLAP